VEGDLGDLCWTDANESCIDDELWWAKWVWADTAKYSNILEKQPTWYYANSQASERIWKSKSHTGFLFCEELFPLLLWLRKYRPYTAGDPRRINFAPAHGLGNVLNDWCLLVCYKIHCWYNWLYLFWIILMRSCSGLASIFGFICSVYLVVRLCLRCRVVTVNRNWTVRTAARRSVVLLFRNLFMLWN